MDTNAPLTKQDIADILGAKVDQRFDELKSMIEKQGVDFGAALEKQSTEIGMALEKQNFEIQSIRQYMQEGFETLIHHNEVMDEQIEQLSLKIDGLAKRNDHLAEIKADRSELTALEHSIPEKVEQSVAKMIELNPEMFPRKRAA